jgi:hypothetical protein
MYRMTHKLDGRTYSLGIGNKHVRVFITKLLDDVGSELRTHRWDTTP